MRARNRGSHAFVRGKGGGAKDVSMVERRCDGPRFLLLCQFVRVKGVERQRQLEVWRDHAVVTRSPAQSIDRAVVVKLKRGPIPNETTTTSSIDGCPDCQGFQRCQRMTCFTRERMLKSLRRTCVTERRPKRRYMSLFPVRVGVCVSRFPPRPFLVFKGREAEQQQQVALCVRP